MAIRPSSPSISGIWTSISTRSNSSLAKEEFDLVLMDVQMPEMDGLEGRIAIRERERGAGSPQPVIALTAHAMKGDQEKCLAAGMDGYLTKPIRTQELDHILDQYLAARVKGGV